MRRPRKSAIAKLYGDDYSAIATAKGTRYPVRRVLEFVLWIHLIGIFRRKKFARSFESDSNIRTIVFALNAEIGKYSVQEPVRRSSTSEYHVVSFNSFTRASD